MSTEPQEHDDLWELLGKSRRPALPPDFTRQVIASVESLRASQIEQKPGRPYSSWAGVGLAAAAALFVTLALPNASQDVSSVEDAQLVAALSSHELSTSDLRLLTHLDEVIDAELAAIWSDPL